MSRGRDGLGPKCPVTVLMTGKLDGTSVWSWKGTTLKNKAE